MGKIYQLKITLKNIKPPVWRRVEVPANIKLSQLHDVIQTVMGWYDYHLQSFEIGGVEFFANKEDLSEFGGTLTSKAKLNDYLVVEKQKANYTYDFGDDWKHEILLEAIKDAEKGVTYPRCIGGKRNCPPEDCGGAYGYMELLEILKNPKHPEHEEMLEWVGGGFDPEEFDVALVNELLKQEG